MNPSVAVFLLCSLSFALSSSATVKRNGSTLLLGGTPFRFGGPNIYWLGLDENVPPGTIAYPTHFRIDDALNTSIGMGARVIRSHTLGISCGNALSFEPTLDVFNDKALLAADYAVYRAEQLGLKLIVPLTDNYHYFHGGKHCFTDWLGVPEEQFYTNVSVIGAFQRYVRRLLQHVNPFTKRRYCDSDAILAWETGNELLPTLGSNWTAKMAAFIKSSVDSRHLVLSGTYGVSLEELPEGVIDMHSDHFYPPDADRAVADSLLCRQYNKVFLAGEVGWSYNGTSAMGPMLAAALNQTLSPATCGCLYWSLFPHLDTYGFVQHNDGFTMHYPGDYRFMQESMVTLSQFAVEMGQTGNSSIPSWTSPAVVGTPRLTVLGGRLAWRGAALASTYNVFARGQNHSSFVVVADGITDNQTPWQPPSNLTAAGTCFFVVSFSLSMQQGPASNTVCV